MIESLDGVPPGALAADIVIVGAGVNGCALAAALDGSGRRVLLLEAGGEDGRDELPRAHVSGHPFTGALLGRRYGFGGTGSWWHGQCAPLDAIDFERRPWVAHSGWPISLEQLSPWYARAAEVLGIADQPFDERQWRNRGVTGPATDLQHKFSVFLPRPDIGAVLRPQLLRSTDVHVLLHAAVVEVLPSAVSDRVAGVVAVDRRGRRVTVEAPIVVLAGGGIEVPRLLLASRSMRNAGVANASDNVGRYLHDHPTGLAATIVTSDARRLQTLYNMLYSRRGRSWARMPLSTETQRRHGLLNATSNLVFDHGTGSAVESLKTVARRTHRIRPDETVPTMPAAMASAVQGLPALPSVLWRRYARGLSPGQQPRNIWLRTAAEQPPRADSRVVLTEERDRRGLPLPSIHWVLGEEERLAQKALVEQVASAWQRAGLATVHPMDWLSGGGNWRAHQVDAYHHSGTARMSTSPADGVVDSDQQAHELPGLYVASTAVFPTSGHANPTFTSVALALRLAKRLHDGKG